MKLISFYVKLRTSVLELWPRISFATTASGLQFNYKTACTVAVDFNKKLHHHTLVLDIRERLFSEHQYLSRLLFRPSTKLNVHRSNLEIHGMKCN